MVVKRGLAVTKGTPLRGVTGGGTLPPHVVHMGISEGAPRWGAGFRGGGVRGGWD